MRDWPKLSLPQFCLLDAIDRSLHGRVPVEGHPLQTARSLVRFGLLSSGMCWYSITQRGRDYIRFGTKRRK